MSDPIQMPSAAALAQVAAVRSEPVVEPAERAQTESRDSREHREGEDRSQSAAGGRKLSITRDENLKAFVYRSIDEESGEVVWQWPAEDKLRRAQLLRAMEEQRRAEEHAVDQKA